MMEASPMPPERSSTPHQMGTVPLRHTWLAQCSFCGLPGVEEGIVQTTCRLTSSAAQHGEHENTSSWGRRQALILHYGGTCQKIGGE